MVFKTGLPSISVIMPVYNGEKVISRSLESLLNQTYQNLEVIVVNDGSTDGTADILQSYRQKWGDKLQVLSIENSGPGKARSVGIHHAKGALIGFCDADDYYDLDGFARMEKALRKQRADALYLPLNRVRDGGMYRTSEIAPPYTKANIIRQMKIIGFCNLLVKREYLLSLGDVPSMIYEDVAYVGALLTRVKKLAYFPEPVYYYVYTLDSITNSISNPRITQLTGAIDWAIAHSSKDCRQELVMALARKCEEKIREAWYFGDVFLEKLWDMQDMIETNPVYQKYPDDYKRIRHFLSLPKDTFPPVVYVDGISGTVSEKMVDDIKRKAFRDGAKVIVLGEDMGEISCKFKDREGFAVYCGLKKVLETGGVFAGHRLRFCAPFDCLRHQRAFFGYENKVKLSSQVFGGQKNNPVLQGIYRRWTKALESDVLGVKELMELLEEFLVKKYRLSLNGKAKHIKYPFVTLDPSIVTFDYPGNNVHLCEMAYANAPDGAVVMTPEQIQYLLEKEHRQQTKVARLRIASEIKRKKIYKWILIVGKYKWGWAVLQKLKGRLEKYIGQ